MDRESENNKLCKENVWEADLASFYLVRAVPSESATYGNFHIWWGNMAAALLCLYMVSSQ